MQTPELIDTYSRSILKALAHRADTAPLERLHFTACQYAKIYRDSVGQEIFDQILRASPLSLQTKYSELGAVHFSLVHMRQLLDTLTYEIFISQTTQNAMAANDAEYGERPSSSRQNRRMDKGRLDEMGTSRFVITQKITSLSQSQLELEQSISLLTPVSGFEPAIAIHMGIICEIITILRAAIDRGRSAA